MTTELPACSGEWKRRVEEYHENGERNLADAAGIDLERYRTEALAQLQDLLSNPGAQLRMRVDALESFIREGRFRTSFDGGETSGDPDLEGRRRTESCVLGLDLDSGVERRPVYAYLRGSDERGNALNSFGSVRLALSPTVLERATVVLGDSHGSTGVGSLPIFAAESALDPSLLCSFVGSQDLRQVEDLVRATDPSFRYAELQIYGGLELRDVTFVTFSQGHPAAEDTMAFLEHNEIRSVVVDGHPV